MARTNIAHRPHTHEGGRAAIISPEAQLRRSLMACLLWEREFYEDGESIANRLADLATKVDPQTVAAMAIEARTEHHLRHAPLFLCAALAQRDPLTAGNALPMLFQRADDMTEFLALYWKDGKRPVPAAMKRAYRTAFGKFDAYQLAKYDRKAPVRLRDLLRLFHPKPENDAQSATWGKLLNGTLEPPNTWEVHLSSGADKRETWERLLAEGALGDLALLRNLRNMVKAYVDLGAIKSAIERSSFRRILPFQFIAAAKAAPLLEPTLDHALSRVTHDFRLTGSTVLLIDVSGSMGQPLSRKSEMNLRDAAAGLAMLTREIAPECRVFTFSQSVIEVPARRGFGLRDVIADSQAHLGTRLSEAVALMPDADRLIVLSDEQAHSLRLPKWRGTGRPYMVNLASYKNGVGYGEHWTHVDGFSTTVLKWIAESEAEAKPAIG